MGDVYGRTRPPNSPQYWATRKREAEEVLGKWREEVRRQCKLGEQPRWTFDELMLAYLRDTQGRKRSAERDRYSAKQLYGSFSGMALCEIGAAEITRYKVRRMAEGVTDATIAKELRLFSSSVNHARKHWGWSVENPVVGRCPPDSVRRLRWLTKEEAGKLVDAAALAKRAPWVKNFIELGLSTGMRSGEMLGLEWSRVDVGQRLIYLEPEDQKNGTHGSVPINDDALSVLLRRFRFRQERCAASPWVFCDHRGRRVASIKRGFQGACERSGIEDCTPHTLRHTAAAWMTQAGVPTRIIAGVLRHKDLRTTMRYSHLSSSALRDGVEQLSRLRHVGENNGR